MYIYPPPFLQQRALQKLLVVFLLSYSVQSSEVLDRPLRSPNWPEGSEKPIPTSDY